MAKSKTDDCKDCGRHVGRKNLSNKGLCYECARKRMVKFFDDFWKKTHPTL